MELLKVKSVSKIYQMGETKIKALDQVSFTVDRGEFIAITGPSGSGKSTLLHILGGIDRPTDGDIWIEGANIKNMSEKKLAIFRRRQVGLIYQFYNLIPILDVEENMMLPLLLDGQKKNNQYVDELLTSLGLEDRRHHLPSQLSGGQQQRVSIGRALMNRPALILADEPTGNLDRKNSTEIVALLKEANRKYGQTVIMITHDEQIALQCDRILYLEDGRLQ